eukprot:3479859-Rhodomonas_salina.1
MLCSCAVLLCYEMLRSYACSYAMTCYSPMICSYATYTECLRPCHAIPVTRCTDPDNEYDYSLVLLVPPVLLSVVVVVLLVQSEYDSYEYPSRA